LSDALRTKDLLGEKNRNILGVVLNRISRKDQIRGDHVSLFMELPIIGMIRDDKRVRKSIESKNPVVLNYPKSEVSTDFRRVAYSLLDREPNLTPALWDRLRGFFRL